MEDVSKVLLIAGAILIILMILGLGIVFIAKSEVLTKMFSDNLSEQEIAAHNAVFSVYEGEISGTELISLILTTQTNNSKSKSELQVKLEYDTSLKTSMLITDYTNTGQIISKIDKNRKYTTNLIYDGKGKIYKIKIK